jgi:hypothetical protein
MIMARSLSGHRCQPPFARSEPFAPRLLTGEKSAVRTISTIVALNRSLASRMKGWLSVPHQRTNSSRSRSLSGRCGVAVGVSRTVPANSFSCSSRSGIAFMALRRAFMDVLSRSTTPALPPLVAPVTVFRQRTAFAGNPTIPVRAVVARHRDYKLPCPAEACSRHRMLNLSEESPLAQCDG